MKPIAAIAIALVTALGAFAGVSVADSKITVVAAENFYGSVAQEIGGDSVSVTSILNNPDQDPHLFETSPSVVREVAAAQIVIYNGADYDPWMERLLKVTSRPGRVVIVAGDLMHKKPGDNPHIWYDPSTMPAVAEAFASALGTADPAHRNNYAVRLKAFLASLQPLDDKIAAIRGKYAGVAVTATEPIFGYMAAVLQLTMLNQGFQRAMMNNTEPGARDIASFEENLKTHNARVMFYNKQAPDNVVRHLLELARASHVAVVGVTETCPPGLSYRDWMLAELNETETALAGAAS